MRVGKTNGCGANQLPGFCNNSGEFRFACLHAAGKFADAVVAVICMGMGRDFLKLAPQRCAVTIIIMGMGFLLTFAADQGRFTVAVIFVLVGFVFIQAD
jgi:hypothetical protein